MTNGQRRDAQFLLGVAAVGSAIAIVSWLSALQDWKRSGDGIVWWKPLVWESTSVATLVLLAPLVIALTRRVQPMVRPWPRVLIVHAFAAVAFSVAHVTAMGALRAVIFDLVGDSYSALLPLRNFVYEFRKDMLVYAGVVGAYAVWLRMMPPSGTAVALETIEVKDGARRRFVAPSDILWIEAAGNYVELHTAGQAILHRAPLSELERQLGADFVRVHRSRLVRRSAVAQADSRPTGDYVIRLSDGREVSGSRRYRRPLLEP